VFAGNVLEHHPWHHGKILCGRAIALNAAVTMDNNTISNDCTGGGDFNTGRGDFGLGFSGPIEGSSAPVPEPVSIVLLATGLIGLAAVHMRRGGKLKAS
jgi:hypothetical protein